LSWEPTMVREYYRVIGRRWLRLKRPGASVYEYGTVNLILPREFIGKRAKIIVLVEPDGKDTGAKEPVVAEKAGE